MELEEFFKQYKPVAKEGATFLDYDGKLYGVPHQGYIPQEVDIRHIWTVVENCEGDEWLIVPGIAIVNRIGHVVTEVRYDGDYDDKDAVVY